MIFGNLRNFRLFRIFGFFLIFSFYVRDVFFSFNVRDVFFTFYVRDVFFKFPLRLNWFLVVLRCTRLCFVLHLDFLAVLRFVLRFVVVALSGALYLIVLRAARRFVSFRFVCALLSGSGRAASSSSKLLLFSAQFGVSRLLICKYVAIFSHYNNLFY